MDRIKLKNISNSQHIPRSIELAWMSQGKVDGQEFNYCKGIIPV